MISGIRLRSRSFCARSKPFMRGMLMSSTARCGLLALERVERRQPVLGLHDEEPRLLQREARHRQQIRVVVDEQDLHAGASCGSSTVARVRPCSVRSRRTVPPCRSTIERDDVEAETDAALVAVGLAARAAELIEQPRILDARRSDALVLDPEREPTRAVAARADANRAVRRGELVGVREQVDEHLRQALLVAAHDGHVRRRSRPRCAARAARSAAR